MKLTLLVISALLFNFSNAFGWGQYGHQQINDDAVALISSAHDFGRCLDQARHWVKRLASTPDIEWKTNVQLPKLSPDIKAKRQKANAHEHKLHFFEPDGFLSDIKPRQILGLPIGEYKDVFEEYRNLLTTHSGIKHPTNKMITEHGTAPWRIVQLYRLAVDALKDGKDVKRAVFFLGSMGHYVGDLSQPLHTTQDFDGETYGKTHDTHTRGIHEEIDSKIFPDENKDEDVVYGSFKNTQDDVHTESSTIVAKVGLDTLTIENILPEVFGIVDTSYELIDPFLGAYAAQCNQANKKGADVANPYCEVNPIKKRPKAKALPKAFRDAFHTTKIGENTVFGTVKKRLGTSAATLARIWDLAYRTAGKPEIKPADCAGISFTSEFSIENYPFPEQGNSEGYIPQEPKFR